MAIPEPIFSLPAPVGSFAWQEGKQHYEMPASEIGPDEWAMLSDYERADVTRWRDHEATLHNVETTAEDEGATSAAE